MRSTPLLVIAMTLLLLAACGSGATGTPPPTQRVSVTSPPAASAGTGVSTVAPEPAAGEPCSYLTGADVAAAFGTEPVEIAERVGRGDCDYWLNEARDSKVNVAVATGAEADTYYSSVEALGEPTALDLGDESFYVAVGGIGTVVVVRQGESVVAVQALLGEGAGDAAAELALATDLAEVVLGRL